jgi:hypothetical protein
MRRFTGAVHMYGGDFINQPAGSGVRYITGQQIRIDAASLLKFPNGPAEGLAFVTPTGSRRLPLSGIRAAIDSALYAAMPH